MAYIRKHSNGWQAQVQCDGVRRSRVLESKESAEGWAAAVEVTLKKRGRARALCRTDSATDVKLLSAVPTKVLSALSSIPYDAETLIAASIPCTTMCGIYFLVVANEIVYVGQSVDVLKRISRHMQDGRSFDSFSFITCAKDALDELETQYISALMPAWNVSLGRSSFF